MTDLYIKLLPHELLTKAHGSNLIFVSRFEADRRFIVRLVEEGKCIAHNTCAWLYEKGNHGRKNVFNCEPRDTGRDRWAPSAAEEFADQLIQAMETKDVEVTVKPK